MLLSADDSNAFVVNKTLKELRHNTEKAETLMLYLIYQTVTSASM